MIEATSHLILRGVWSEMRENAELSAAAGGRAVDLLAKRMVELRDMLKADDRPLEVHLVGHSAGSILLGWLVDRLVAKSLLASAPRCLVHPVRGRVFGPVCHRHLWQSCAGRRCSDLKHLYLHYLTDANERADGLPSAYAALRQIAALSRRASARRRAQDAAAGAAEGDRPGSLDPKTGRADQLEVITLLAPIVDAGHAARLSADFR